MPAFFGAPVALGTKPLSYAVAVAIGALAYFFAAELGLKLASLLDAASPVWPASGLAVAMIHMFGRRAWPAIALGAFAVHALLAGPWIALPIAVGNTLEGVVGGYILTSLFKRESETFLLARSAGYASAALLATTIGATFGVATLTFAGSLASDLAGGVWLTWWIGDAIGIMIVAPAIAAIAIVAPGRPTPANWRPAAGWALKPSVLLGAVAAILALTSVEPRAAAAVFLAFPLVLLARRGFGRLGSTGTVPLFAIGLIGQVIAGIGPFAEASLNENLLVLQIFLAALAVSALVLADINGRDMRVPGFAFLVACAFAAAVFAMTWRAGQQFEYESRWQGLLLSVALVLLGTLLAALIANLQSLRTRAGAIAVEMNRALAASNARLHAAVNAMEDGFGLFDADDRIVLHNAAFMDEGSRKTFGDDVAGRKFEEIVRAFAYRDMPVAESGFDREAWIAERMERHRNPPPHPIEVKWSGNRWMRISERRTADGGSVGIWTDISALKLAEERLKTAIDAMDSGFALFDANDRLIIHNDGFIDMSVAEAFGGDARGRTFEEIIRAFAGSKVTAVEVGQAPEEWIRRRVERHRNPTLEPFDQQQTDGAWVRISERRTADGGYVGTWTDITGLKLAEARLTDAIENINEGFVLVDANNRFVIVNRHFIDMYPKSGKLAVPGARLEDVLRYAAERGEYPGIEGQEQIDAFVKHWVEFYRTRQPYVGERQLADGRWVLVSHRPTSHGGYVSIRTDITAQKRREAELRSARDDLEVRSADLVTLAEELEQARRAADIANLGKSQFVANMAHELRTPLNAINGFSELMLKELFGPIQPAKYREYAEFINQSGQHLLAVINAVLDLSKIEAGKMELHVEALPSEQVAYASIEGVRTMAADRGVQLKTNIDADCPILHADPRAIRQILLNLLSNAVKFTPSAGTVTLAISCDDAGVDIAVTDTGIGMTADEARKALELYGQVESDLAKKQAGTGLGLPLAKSLVELHGGRLMLSSEKGKGTTASVVFPWNQKLPVRLN